MDSKTVDVIVFENRENKGRYLALSMEYGDFGDENLDNAFEDIENCFMLWKKDLTKPDIEESMKEFKKQSDRTKEIMKERFGDNFFLSIDYDKIIKMYEPKIVTISHEQFEIAKNMEE